MNLEDFIKMRVEDFIKTIKEHKKNWTLKKQVLYCLKQKKHQKNK